MTDGPVDPLRGRGGAELSPASHVSLLGRSRALQRSAMRSDVDAVQQELIDLRLALTMHVVAEQADVNDLSWSASGLVVRGQRELLRLIDELIAARGRGGQPYLRAAVDLTRRLSRQARVEDGLLGRSKAPASSDDRFLEVDP